MRSSLNIETMVDLLGELDQYELVTFRSFKRYVSR